MIVMAGMSVMCHLLRIDRPAGTVRGRRGRHGLLIRIEPPHVQAHAGSLRCNSGARAFKARWFSRFEPCFRLLASGQVVNRPLAKERGTR